jgi:hypothetical protein
MSKPFPVAALRAVDRPADATPLNIHGVFLMSSAFLRLVYLQAMR